MSRPLRALLTLCLSLAAPVAAAGGIKPLKALTQITQPDRWLNTSRALTRDDLENRVLLVDFWTYACINCLHLIPDLKALEAEFGNRLTVIGVHSAKFAGEKDADSLRAAVLRLGIEHPVVNDREFQIASDFEIAGWPTLALIDRNGKVAKRYSGEGHLAEVRKDIAEQLARAPEPAGLAALPLASEREKEKKGSLLRFPGKLAWAMHDGKPYLFVADSGNHRIVGISLENPNFGKVRLRIGRAGESGNADGDFETTRFHSPRGIVYQDGVLFVADTGNHTVREIDLRRRRVTTIAGNGKRSTGPTFAPPVVETPSAASEGAAGKPSEATPGKPSGERKFVEVPALTTSLSSPWDVALYPTPRQVVIAMAGTHQLWSYDRDKKTLSVIAGSGIESIDDGIYPENTLAQPSGLSAFDGKLFFVDSETSSLRQLEAGKLTTLIGTGLFDFGFRDGVAGRGLMQHPLGVFAAREGIYVADSFNHAIRRFAPLSGQLDTLAGTGKAGPAAEGDLAQATFGEPGAVAGTKSFLYVADTNNHAVRVIDLKEKRIHELLIDDSGAAERAISADRQPSENLPRVKPLPPIEVTAEETIEVALDFAPGEKLNPQAPTWMALYQLGEKEPLLIKEFGRGDFRRGKAKLPPLSPGASYRLQGTFYTCGGKASICRLQSFDQTVKASVDAERDLIEIPLT